MQHPVRFSPRLLHSRNKSHRGWLWITLLLVVPVIGIAVWGSIRAWYRA